MDLDSLIFSGSAFLAGLVLLQYGSGAFIDNTAVVARRLGVSETLIALLIAGTEWEELAVVLASIIQHQPSLGLGNILGSCVGNILGAFALVLLTYGGTMEFDRTARIYAGAQFIITSMFALIACEELLNLTGGIFFLVSFFVYLFSVAEGIYEGFMSAPEVKREVEEDETGGREDDETAPTDSQQHAELHIALYPSVMACHPNSTTSLLHNPPTATPRSSSPSTQSRQRRSTTFHLIKLLLGLTSTAISGFVLSQFATSLSGTLHLSSTVVGLTILSIATTLPEKVISVLSGLKGRPGILVASTAGCNIFLLTLCLGVLFVSGGTGAGGDGGGNSELAKNVRSFEIWCCWWSSLILMGVTWIGGRPWMGGLLLGLYAGFLGCELTVFKQ